MKADAAEGTDEDGKLRQLAFLIADYEKRTVILPQASPAEVIQFEMEQRRPVQQDIGLKGLARNPFSPPPELPQGRHRGSAGVD